MLYGSIPAGGLGTRLQPIGFSKELAPVGGKAVIEHLIERMISSGVDKIFINTAADKTDLIKYLSAKSSYKDNLIFMVRGRKGLQDGILLPAQFLRPDDQLVFGLPDTIWFPKNGFKQLIDFKPQEKLALGLFDTGRPESYDSVVVDKTGKIKSVEVKVSQPKSSWTWGIGRVQISEVGKLEKFAAKQGSSPLFGTSLHAYAQTHPAYAIKLEGSSYLDVGIREDLARTGSFLTKNGK